MILSLLRNLRFLLRHPLNRRHPAAALGRFINWQLSAPADKDKVIMPFVQDTVFYAARGWTGVTGNIYCGLHEFSDMAFVLHVLRPEDLFIDAGANMGSYTILASGVCRASAIAIEPAPATFRHLLDNIELNKLTELVTAVPAGLAAAPGNLAFSTDRGTMNQVLQEGQGSLLTVTTLDQLSSAAISNDMLLLKLDVEGYESEVLKGAVSLLATAALKAIIIELNGSGAVYGYDDAAIHEQLLQQGFRPYAYDPFKRELKELSTPGKHNTLYLRDLSFVRQRIEKAPVFTVLDQRL